MKLEGANKRLARRLGAGSIIATATLLAVAFGNTGCGDDESCEDGGGGTGGTPLEQALETIADIAYASYSDSVTTAEALSDAIDDLLAAPSEDTLRAARARWLDAREPYGQTEAFRFQAGPIDSLRDDGTIGDDGDGPEGRINAWPLAEAVIDYVEPGTDLVEFGDPETDPFPPSGVTTNIIVDNAATPTNIDADYLESLLFVDGEDERSVTTGFHAVEFLLWGQDLNASDPVGEGPRDTTAGQRGFEDFLEVGSGCLDGAGATDTCDARRQYLRVVMDLLLDDLRNVRDQWAPGAPTNYRDDFVAGGLDTIDFVLAGLGEFGPGELVGERIFPALDFASQEDEHSCFADNTHRDLILNAVGIDNIVRGRYLGATPVNGVGIYDVLVAEGLAAEADELLAALDAGLPLMNAIGDEFRVNGTPFDNLIEDTNDPVVTAAASAWDAEEQGQVGTELEDAYNALFD